MNWSVTLAFFVVAAPLCAEGYVEDSRSEANIALLRLNTALQKRFDAGGGRLERHFTPLELEPRLYFEHFSVENYSISYPASLDQPVIIRCTGIFRGDFWQQTMEMSVNLVQHTRQRTESPHEPFLFELLPRWGGALSLMMPIVGLVVGDAMQKRRRQLNKQRRTGSAFAAAFGALVLVFGCFSAIYVRLEFHFEWRFVSLLVPLGIALLELSGRLIAESPGRLTAVACLAALATTAVSTDLGANYWYGGTPAATMIATGTLIVTTVYIARFRRAGARTES